MARYITVGAAQSGPVSLRETRADVIARLIEQMREAHGRGCDLVVFTECALTAFFPHWFMESQEEIDSYFEREMPGAQTRPLFDEAARLFPKALGDVSLDAFYGAINTVEPSFIRVEADELTYNLHVILRFEIERELFNGQLEVDDIPKRWNVKMEDLLGITPPDDAQGCLQDIHWSMGAFGYLATYALGKLYAAQFFTKAKEDIPDLFDRIRANDHKPLLNWLRENIHRHGQRFRAGELVERVTGKPLTIEPFMSYVKNKFAPIYGL